MLNIMHLEISWYPWACMIHILHIDLFITRSMLFTFVDQTLSFQYDIMGRMTKTSSADEVREYDYDLNGRLTLAKNPTSENQFELDALGNVLREIHSYSNTSLVLTSTTLLPILRPNTS
nr:hypothetical protein [Taylorella equigenitalis]